MSAELKKVIDDVSAAFTEFKAANDERLTQIEARGSASAELDAKVDKINDAITALQDEHQQLETELARPRVAVDPKVQADTRKSAAQFLAAVRRGKVDEVMAGITEDDLAAVRDYGPAFQAYLRRGGLNGDGLNADVRAAMSVGSDPEGGYNVPPDTDGEIVRLIFESSPIRQIASVETTRSDRKTGTNDLDESGGGWVGETGSRSDTATPEIGKWEIPVRELYAQPKATQQDIDDSIVDMEAFLVEKASSKLARLEATAFVTGDGVAKPRGFLTYADGTPSASTWNVIQQSDTGVNGDFHATLPGDVFHTVIGTMKADYLPNAMWVTNRVTMAAARKEKDGDGTYLWEKSFQAAQPFMILGYPVRLAEDMPAMATGSLSIAFGDFRAGYKVIDRIGIRVLRDPYTDKPFVKFYTTRRVGGDVVNFEAIKLINFQA